ncbi:hypothetical protein [Prosthecobacter sp.]|uniref:hypothetical protein n=1 Tax=Prosthecobacter sp. TaxID=1965333 RepID=UPI003784479B
MKPYLLILALMTSYLNAAAPAFPNRSWKADTPGLTMSKDASYDDATGTIEVTASDKAVIPLLVDAQPNVGTHSYALKGEVKYEKVGGTGFLETWTSIGAGKAFSRSLGDYGPMGKLTGTSAWREFILPMNMMGSSEPAKQIEMNVVLPDGGKVWLRHLRLEPMDFGASGFPFMTIMIAASAGTAAIVVLVVWRSKRRRSRETEIKRMMAADA